MRPSPRQADEIGPAGERPVGALVDDQVSEPASDVVGIRAFAVSVPGPQEAEQRQPRQPGRRGFTRPFSVGPQRHRFATRIASKRVPRAVGALVLGEVLKRRGDGGFGRIVAAVLVEREPFVVAEAVREIADLEPGDRGGGDR